MGNLNPYSHLTAKEREYLSFPARLLFEKGNLIGSVLDFGCGFGKDVEVLKTRGVEITGYDKHYFPDFPTQRFDTILCLYVLNVLLPAEQALILMEVSSLLKPGGKAYFAVRRDLRAEGYRTHKIHQKPTFQTNVILPFQSIFKNESCEIYEYIHYNFTQSEVRECPFCAPSKEVELIVESAQAYSIFDKYPVSPGHGLIIPKRHVSDYFN